MLEVSNYRTGRHPLCCHIFVNSAEEIGKTTGILHVHWDSTFTHNNWRSSKRTICRLDYIANLQGKIVACPLLAPIEALQGELALLLLLDTISYNNNFDLTRERPWTFTENSPNAF